MEPSSLGIQNLQVFQSFIKVGQADPSDTPKIAVNEKLGYMILHSDSTPSKVEVTAPLIKAEEVLRILQLLNKFYIRNEVTEDFYLQVLQGTRRLAETQKDPAILEAAKTALRSLKENSAIQSKVIEKALSIINTAPMAPNLSAEAPWRTKIETLRKKGIAKPESNLVDSIKESARRMWINEYTLKALDATKAFLPPGVGNPAKIEEVLKVLVKSEEDLIRYLKVLQSVQIAYQKNFEMLKKVIPPTLTDAQNLVASDFVYTLIADISAELEDPIIAKPINQFLQSLMEQAAPMNYQTVTDILMMGVRAAKYGTETRRNEAIEHLQNHIGDFPPSEQDVIRENFRKRDVGFDLWERVDWKPLIEIPLEGGNRILLKGSIEGEFVRPEKAIAPFSIPLDLTFFADKNLKFEEYLQIFQFLKDFVGHSSEKAYPKYEGEKKSFQRIEAEREYIEEQRKKLPFLDQEGFDKLVATSLNFRSRLEYEINRALLKVNNPQLML